MKPVDTIWLVACKNGQIHCVNEHAHYRLAVLAKDVALSVALAFDSVGCGPHTVVQYEYERTVWLGQ